MNNFITRPPVPGEVIFFRLVDEEESKEKKVPDTEKFRVLYTNVALDRIIYIRATPKQSSGRLYFSNPRVEKLSWLMSPEISEQYQFLSGGLPLRPDVTATPEELDKKYLRRGQQHSFPRTERECRYRLIEPLISGADPDDKLLLFDPTIRRERIERLARDIAKSTKDFNRIRRRITDTLNQYWAEGSRKGSVTPFTSKCGGRGKEKTLRNKKPGRKNQPTTLGEVGLDGHILSEAEKKQCGYAWRNFYTRGKTLAKAYRKFKRVFYSDIVLDPDGSQREVVRAKHLCPTKEQFAYWGQKKAPGHEIWKKQLSPRALARIDRVLFGTSNENIVKIGQRGAIDSTTTDQELVSVINRIGRIGQAHRVLIVDGKYKYIPGFYMGLDSPGSLPVQLACLHALTDKAEWLKWLGLEDQDLANWIPIRFAMLHADNTDARAAAAMEALDRVQTGLKFVPVARSDMNSDVETTHHALHRMVDHNLVGTTYGQKSERGEEKAEVLARMTIVEAIRETARAVYAWNTMELKIQPTLEMQRELVSKGIKLTRANLTRWEIERGNLAASLISEDEARTALLIPTRGTFTPFGIRLLRSDSGDKRTFVPNVRYISHDNFVLEKCLASKVSRSRVMPTAFDDDFLHDPYRPSEIYYRDLHTGKLIALSAKSADIDLLEECSLVDIQELGDANKLREFYAESERERQLSDLEAAQEAANEAAEGAYQKDIEAAGKKPSKSAIRKGKKTNREVEKLLMSHGLPIISPDLSIPDEQASEIGETADLHFGQSIVAVSEVPLREAVIPTPDTTSASRRQSMFARIVQTRQMESSHV